MLEMLWKFVQLFTLTRFNAVYYIKNILKKDFHVMNFRKNERGELEKSRNFTWGGEGMGNTRELGTGKEPLSFLNICGEMLDVKCVRTKYATKTLLS